VLFRSQKIFSECAEFLKLCTIWKLLALNYTIKGILK